VSCMCRACVAASELVNLRGPSDKRCARSERDCALAKEAFSFVLLAFPTFFRTVALSPFFFLFPPSSFHFGGKYEKSLIYGAGAGGGPASSFSFIFAVRADNANCKKSTTCLFDIVFKALMSS
jgi:hypothetical protein